MKKGKLRQTTNFSGAEGKRPVAERKTALGA